MQIKNVFSLHHASSNLCQSVPEHLRILQAARSHRLGGRFASFRHRTDRDMLTGSMPERVKSGRGTQINPNPRSVICNNA